MATQIFITILGNFDIFPQTNETKEEKKDDVENEKDAVTEKSEQPAAATVAAEAAADAPAPAAEPTAAETKAEEKPTVAENGDGGENAADTTTGTLDESKDGVENTGESDANASSTPVTDSAKKAKKDKSKKRFLSFRSFSFSKKDKTKPKKEEAAAANTTNGDCEKVPEEVSELCTCACVHFKCLKCFPLLFLSILYTIISKYSVHELDSECVNDYIMSIGRTNIFKYVYIDTRI